MALSVFISYSTHDLASASALQGWVKQAGAQPFVAQYSVDPGQALAPSIQTAIQSCDLFLLLWSEHAQSSAWVPQEVGIAQGAGKQIIPVVLQQGVPLPGFLQGVKYLAVYEDPSATIQWLHDNVVERVKAHQRDLLIVLGILGALLLLLALSNDG